jgi:hypothetical protein
MAGRVQLNWQQEWRLQCEVDFKTFTVALTLTAVCLLDEDKYTLIDKGRQWEVTKLL